MSFTSFSSYYGKDFFVCFFSFLAPSGSPFNFMASGYFTANGANPVVLAHCNVDCLLRRRHFAWLT